MLNQNQRVHPSNESAEAAEIPPFSGVIDSSFVQRIAHNYIKPPRAFLFSHYILSKIQRRLAEETSAVSVKDFAPYTLETPAVGRKESSENVLATEESSVDHLSASPLQHLSLNTSVKNTLGQFDLQTARESISSAEKVKQRSGSDFLFSKEPSRVLSVKPVVHEVTTERSEQEGIISQDFLQKKEEVFPQSGTLTESSVLSLPGLTKSLSFVSLEGQVKPSSESSKIEEYSTPPSNEAFERIGIFRKPVSSIPLSITDASFADAVAEKSKPEDSIVGSDTPSRIGQLKLATLREVEPIGGELTYVQRQVEQPDESAETRETGVQLEEKGTFRAPSEFSQVEVSEKPPSNFERIGIFLKPVSSVPVNITDASFADTVAEKSKPEAPIVGSDIPSRIGQLNLVTLREAPIGGELTHVQRQVEQPGAKTKGTGVQLEEKGAFRAPTAQGTRSVLAGAVPVLARGSREPVVQSLPGLQPTAFSGLTDLVSPNRQDEILTFQDELAEGASAATYRQPAEQTWEAPNLESLPRFSGWLRAPVTTDNINVLRRSVLPSSVVAMHIFRRYLDMPHVRLHNDSSANFMATKLNAEAFTIERDVFFASGKLNFSTPRGVALLGHELTHVKQQEQQSAASNIGEMGAPQYEALENEALANEQTILSFLSPIGRWKDYARPSFASPVVAKEEGRLQDGMVELTPIRPPQIQFATPQRTSTPLMAEEGRGIETPATAETPAPPTPEPEKPSMDINRIAEEVYGIIERRLRSEKERRGHF